MSLGRGDPALHPNLELWAFGVIGLNEEDVLVGARFLACIGDLDSEPRPPLDRDLFQLPADPETLARANAANFERIVGIRENRGLGFDGFTRLALEPDSIGLNLREGPNLKEYVGDKPSCTAG